VIEDMSNFPSALEKLVEQFASLPGVGGKSAQRMAFYILRLSDNEAKAFADAIIQAKKQVHRCSVCQNLTDRAVCPICSGSKRDVSVICVVSDPKDVAAMERSREYNGHYHVLHGVISPMNHVGPDDIAIKELLKRVNGGEVREVIMATNPDTEGEATAMYISRLIKPLGVKVTRIAYGIPVGSNLEFADEATLFRALEGRREM
jgi:recombination protein RecR